MPRYDRYAIYWVPPLGDRLARFGLDWTGWCAETASLHHRAHQMVEGVDLGPITQEPARQGFHGLIRAPFRLDDPRRIWMLERELFDAAESCPELTLPRLVVGVAGNRVALVPAVRDSALATLLQRVQRATVPFAPDDPIEPQPCAISDGVPVRSVHGFHMPLTDQLPLATACSLAERLAPALEPLLDTHSVVSELVVVIDPGDGRRVRVVQRLGLGEIGAPVPEPFACRGPRLLAPFPFEGARRMMGGPA